jgi:hypothetical protein
MNKYFFNLTFLLSFVAFSVGFGQKKSYDLQQLFKEKKLITYNGNAVPLTDGDKKGISVQSTGKTGSREGVVWLKDVAFSTGTIEIDLRGKDVLQKSFIGIAFHGVDTVTHDLIYFRPFNFRAEDPIRKIHAVQYVSHPEFPWHVLREKHNGIYEKGIEPPPLGTDWFHARIVVGETQIKVYVNNAATPSLTVNKLNKRTTGLIGLSNEGLPGDFANLTITK